MYPNLMNELPQSREGHRNVIIEILNHALREDRLPKEKPPPFPVECQRVSKALYSSVLPPTSPTLT